jgi:hypothetical protein
MNEPNGARTVHDARTSGQRRPDITASMLANNAAATDQKPPATQAAHQPWYHYFWW